MPSRPARLLCAGKDMGLLNTRCAVLWRSGYVAHPAALSEAENLARTKEFDLIIVSAWLSERETNRILAAAGETPALVLTEMTSADELLARVERLLAPAHFKPFLVSRTDLL
jgi:DNA-binding response OmpR family regulator